MYTSRGARRNAGSQAFLRHNTSTSTSTDDDDACTMCCISISVLIVFIVIFNFLISMTIKSSNFMPK